MWNWNHMSGSNFIIKWQPTKQQLIFWIRRQIVDCNRENLGEYRYADSKERGHEIEKLVWNERQMCIPTCIVP